MNASLIPIYGKTKIAQKLRELSEYLKQKADLVEASRSLTRRHREILEKNKIFEDKHKDQPAFVIVNGPSLAKQDLSQLNNYITYAVSGFWKHEIVSSWQPTYYSLLDANYFSDNQPAREFYKNLNSRIHDSKYFVPLFRGFDAVKNNNLLPEADTYYVAAIGGEIAENDLSQIVQSFAGVSAFALSQAIYMGCNPIYLIGFDHDYLANRGVDRHFYLGGTLPGHGSTNIPLAERIPYDEEMRANLKLWKNYRVLDQAAKKKGIKIYNATLGGYLDVFPRIEYDSILKN